MFIFCHCSLRQVTWLQIISTNMMCNKGVRLFWLALVATYCAKFFPGFCGCTFNFLNKIVFHSKPSSVVPGHKVLLEGRGPRSSLLRLLWRTSQFKLPNYNPQYKHVRSAFIVTSLDIVIHVSMCQMTFSALDLWYFNQKIASNCKTS